MEPERYAERGSGLQHRGRVGTLSRVAGTAARTNEFGQPIGMSVAGWKSPPAPQRSLLQGQFCQVEPLCEQTHGRSLFDAFAAAAARGVNWTYMPYGPFTAYADFSPLSTITAAHSTDIVAVVGS